MSTKAIAAPALLIATALLVSGCVGRDANSGGDNEIELTTTTPAAVGEADAQNWAIYRGTISLDPIYAFDSPESEPVVAMCETLLTMQPDLSLAPGLATSVEYTDPMTLVIDIDERATFWDGSAVTADDVVFSLERNRDPALGGYFSAGLSRVDTISATAPDQVTLTLTEADYWLRDTMATASGVVVQKAFAEAAGAGFGTPDGGVLCSGPFTFGSWTAGGPVTLERNDNYWRSDQTALVPSITFTPVSSDANLAAGFRTGDIDGYYIVGSTVFQELADSDNVTAWVGPGLITDALAVPDPSGPMGDERMRQAISLAIDRQNYIDQLYFGQGAVPATVSNPNSWGFGADSFDSVLGDLAPITTDLDAARALVAEAGYEGATLTYATASGIAAFDISSSVTQEAVESLGLKLELQTIPLDKYNEIYFNPEARAGIDLFFTLGQPYTADPGPFLESIATAGGVNNISGWSNDEVSSLLAEARSTADDDERARLTAEAEKLVTAALPQIPLAHPYNVLYLNNELTGPTASGSYFFGPWANFVGAAE